MIKPILLAITAVLYFVTIGYSVELDNREEWQVNLDQFGLVRQANKVVVSPQPAPNATDQAATIEMAKNFIVENSKYTGVINKDALDVNRNPTINRNRMTFSFKNQTYQGIVIENMNIYIVADNGGILKITGHWYPRINITTEPKINLDEVKKKIIGQETTVGEAGGLPEKVLFSGEAKNFESGELVILPVDDDRLTLCWKIFYKQQRLPWIIYVDAISGDIIKIQPNFVT